MKTEKTLMLTGKEYQHIRKYLETNPVYEYRTIESDHPETFRVTDIYLDTDPDFTRNPRQFARVDDDLRVQAKIVYEEIV